MLQLDVRDNGPGFPDEVLAKPFEPYVTHKSGGSGLGLAICRKIVTDHDGSIEISNPAGGGALARIVLPMRVTGEQLENLRGSTQRLTRRTARFGLFFCCVNTTPGHRPIGPGRSHPAMSQASILVVDDEQDIRNLVSEILEDEGYAVTTAENGETARAAFSSGDPDLVLLDIWMPDIDGITLLKEWTASGRLNCPVVMISGHGTLETAVEATRLGAFDFVQKPLSLAKLLATVRTALAANVRENDGASRAKAASAPQGSSSQSQLAAPHGAAGRSAPGPRC